MKTLFAMAATGTLLLSGIASAREFRVYELSGFPNHCVRHSLRYCRNLDLTNFSHARAQLLFEFEF